ncbi:tetratricopeptide repeat protein [Microbulbifer pacificus]|uniref:Tetratricopeptide repeat protein n=1 Tax=Microbulbifer pacificus TaxID=407164 RepID=A0AAU0MXB5_9GAMM|nr:tetratricopeptide repeat protein [Microbulbifer pacificus]WOX04758.1 tetratricopeptide repeat protein [Microbulbifer pacificus]
MNSRLASAIAGAALSALCAVSAQAKAPVDPDPKALHTEKLRDLFFGEALFNAHQDKYFDAITELDTELKQFRLLDDPELDPFSLHFGQAEFAVGDLELSYRMHRDAGRAMEQVLKGNVPQPIKNEAAFRLAKIHYHKQQFADALHALELIEGRVPERVRADEQFLRARVYMQLGRFEEAVALLKDLKGEKSLAGFVEYNLGIALLKAGDTEKGVLELDGLGRNAGGTDAMGALQDKTNLLLGFQLMESKDYERARTYFDRVQLSGPFSNQALLGAGWVEANAGRYDRALVPWQLLTERQPTNASVQEAMLAVPLAYGKLDVHSTAAVNYGHALDLFGAQVDVLTQSIHSIREGKLLEALRRKEASQVKNWVVELRKLPDAPETHYLLDLMASNDYQEFLRNYQDLNDLLERNNDWLQSLDSFEEIIALRRGYYEPILPGLDVQFRQVDARIKMRMEQRQHLAARIENLLINRRPELLAKSDETESRLMLQRIREILAYNPSLNSEETEARIARLEGVLKFRLSREFDERLTEAYKHLQELDTVVATLQETYQRYVRSRQAATHSYEGYTDQIASLRGGLHRAQDRIDQLMARQGRMLEQLAINELDQRRAQLESYQIKARFALADSYDRANELQEQRADARKVEQYQQQVEQLKQSAPAESERKPSEPVANPDGEPLPTDNPPELEAPEHDMEPAGDE